MEVVAPLGAMYQAGTLSGNPLAVTAGIATLKALAKPGTYEGLEAAASRLAQGLSDAARRAEVPLTVNRVGSVLTPFFASGLVDTWDNVTGASRERYAAFFHRMLEQGVYLAPSAFEAAFISAAHTQKDLDRTLEAAESSLEGI